MRQERFSLNSKHNQILWRQLNLGSGAVLSNVKSMAKIPFQHKAADRWILPIMSRICLSVFPLSQIANIIMTSSVCPVISAEHKLKLTIHQLANINTRLHICMFILVLLSLLSWSRQVTNLLEAQLVVLCNGNSENTGSSHCRFLRNAYKIYT